MEPTFYLGAKLKKTVMPNVVVAWGMSSSKYIQAAFQNAQEYLQKDGDRKLKKKAYAPFEATYRAEIDESPVLVLEMSNYFQYQIGIFCWCVEFGRIDIITALHIYVYAALRSLGCGVSPVCIPVPAPQCKSGV
jgi:hypothetical protein